MNAAGSSESAAADTAKAATGSAESLTPGELLRRERERRAMSLLHAAEELHLDTKVVEAIEANQFEKLGVPVYARGHLRNYAALMGLSPEFIIQRYEALTGRPEAPPPIPASVGVGTSVSLNQRRSLAGPLWLAVGLVALIMGWWLWTTVSTPGDPMQSVLSDADITDGNGSTGNESTTISVPPDVTAAPAATPAAMQPAAAAASASDVRLRLEYRDSSWTEIYDATGRRLMFALGESGRSRTVSGTPPLRITLGNASAVTVQVNDRSVVVPRQAGRDSAKFVVAAGGAVQMMSDEVPVE